MILNQSNKRDSTLEEQLGEFLPFIVISSDPSIKKRVNYLSCIEGKGGLKHIYCIA